MYRFKPVLRIPGPVPVPSEVSMQMARPMINHRGAIFREHFPAVLKRLGALFGTENPIYMMTGSGTSGMEVAVSNLVSPETPVLCLVGGFFGQRWADLCTAYGAKMHVLNFPWDQGVDPSKWLTIWVGIPKLNAFSWCRTNLPQPFSTMWSLSPKPEVITELSWLWMP